MQAIYNLLTALLAITGCASLFITGEINPVMSTAGLAIVPGYYRFLNGREPAPRRAVGLLAILTLVTFFFDTTVISGDIFIAVAHLTITFQALKSFDLREPWDHLQVYFMSLLQLVIASELTRTLIFGVIFIVFMITLVTAMVLSHFLKEGNTTGAGIKKPVFYISIMTILATAFFFVSLPRTPYKFLGRSHEKGIKMTGFSEHVDFGALGDIKIDPAVVMRIEMKGDAKLPYYWRGLSLDYFDSISWSKTLKHKKNIKRLGEEFVISSHNKKNAVQQDIYLEPLNSRLLFGLAEVAGIKTEASSLVTDDSNGIYLSRKKVRRIAYTAYSVINAGYPGKRDNRYLQMPGGMDRVISLAQSISSEAGTDRQKARLIEQYLRTNYTYSLSPDPVPEGANPVEHFLFNSKKGYCEHYASSMVLMLRGIGIPSRIVNGFYGGEENDYGGYIIVRQSDAHSWVEALIQGKWIRYDPTPQVPSQKSALLALSIDAVRLFWFQHIVGFSFLEQQKIVRGLSAPLKFYKTRNSKPIGPSLFLLSFSVIIVAGLLLYFLSYRVKFKRHGYVTRKYLALRKQLKKKKLVITPAMTAGDLKRATIGSGLEKDVREFLSLYEQHRFGKKPLGTEGMDHYRKLFMKIKKAD